MKRPKILRGTWIRKIETGMGFPLVFFTDDLNGHGRRWQQRLYFKSGKGYVWYPFDYANRIEHDRVIIAALDKLQWKAGRNCLTTAPWLL